MNRYQSVFNNKRSNTTDIKPNINQLSTNKICQFLEMTVINDEISEQNPNGYCNVDFVFRLGSNICFHDIKVLFCIMNLHLFVIYTPPHHKSLGSLRFDVRSVCYLLCNDIHRYRRGKWCRKCKRYGIKAFVW